MVKSATVVRYIITIWPNHSLQLRHNARGRWCDLREGRWLCLTQWWSTCHLDQLPADIYPPYHTFHAIPFCFYFCYKKMHILKALTFLMTNSWTLYINKINFWIIFPQIWTHILKWRHCFQKISLGYPGLYWGVNPLSLLKYWRQIAISPLVKH